MERVNLLIDQIAQLDEQLRDLVSEQQTLLQSIPGLGPVWAPTILAEILPVFHPEDQHGARKFVATAGLDVKQFDSGEQVGRGRISKPWQPLSAHCRYAGLRNRRFQKP